MFDFELHIYYKWHDRELIKRLQALDPEEGMTFHWAEIADDKRFSLPKDRCTLLITDDPKHLALGRAENDFSNLIYGGEVADAVNCEAVPDQFWGQYPDEIREKMFLKLVRNMYAHFRAHFDRSVLKAFMESSQDMMWVKDLKGVHLGVNQKFAEVVGKTREECCGATQKELLELADEGSAGHAGLSETENEVIRHGEMMNTEELVQIGSEMKQLTTYKAPIYDPFGKIVGTTGIGHDVTEFNNMGLELGILLENLPLPIILCDENFSIIRINDRFRQVTQMGAMEVANMRYQEWKRDNLIPVSEPVENKVRSYTEQEFRLIVRGQEFYYVLIEQAIHDYFGNLSGYYCVYVDMTVQRQYEQTILEAANTDWLTGLYNRRYFYDFVSENAGKAMTMLYIDLDHFKQVNDEYGHARGDDVLKKSAEFICEAFPEGTVARLGGDEFAVLLLDEVDEEQLRKKCEVLDKRIRTICRKGKFYVSASIGFARTDGSQSDVDAFIHEGDVRMYEVKKQHHKEIR